MRRALVALLAAASLAVAVAGCGEDKKSAEAYASDICTATIGWFNGLQQRAANLPAALGPRATPARSKSVLESFFAGALKDTNGLVDKVRDAGVPDVDDGERAADALESAFEEASSLFEQSLQQARALPTDDRQRFAAEARRIGASAQESSTRISRALQTAQSEDLQRAFRGSAECQRQAGVQ